MVDAGGSKNPRRNPLHKTVYEESGSCIDCIDIAICTHSDRDHSGGFSNLIKKWNEVGRKICELWLPYEWSLAYPDHEEFYKGIKYGACEAVEKTFEIKKKIRNRKSNDVILSEIVEESQSKVNYIEGRECDYELASKYKNLIKKDFLSTVKFTGKNIKEVVKTAVEYNIKVRWFDFDNFKKTCHTGGGYPGFLIPLNSVEKKTPAQSTNSLEMFYMCRLTEQNVSSLVFQRAGTEQEPSVFFLADSRLAFGKNKPTKDFPNRSCKIDKPCIYTAPHHGSHNNDHAYRVLCGWLGKSIFQDSIAIKNGGMWNQKAGGFLCIPKRVCATWHRKFCFNHTCQGTRRAQPVQMKSQNNQWAWPPYRGNPC